MKRPCLLSLAALCVGAAVSSAQMTLIAGWDFNGVSSYGDSPMSPTDSHSGVTIEGLARGAGVGTSGTGALGAWGGNNWNEPSSAAAVSAGDFLTFSFSATGAQGNDLLSLSSITAYNVRRSGTGPTTGLWQYSLDGSSFSDVGEAITWGGTTSSSGNLQSAIDLSGISELQSIAAAATVTFRLVNWDASGAIGTWYLNNYQTGSDFAVFGSVSAVPEPSTYGLLFGLGTLGFVIYRRRSRAAGEVATDAVAA